MATRHRFQVDGQMHTVTVEEAGDRLLVTVDDGEPVALDVTTGGVPGLLSIIQDGVPLTAYVVREGRSLRVLVGGRAYVLGPASGGRERGAVGGHADPPGRITAPLAGVVVEVRTAVGDRIAPRQPVVVIEAMKMQNEVQAPLGGTVTAIHCEVGARVDRGVVLVEYAPDDAPAAAPAATGAPEA